tara:strand:- start:5125 stop:5628 length:504 start_codon:yes stop_codon:yes gene_type:complete
VVLKNPMFIEVKVRVNGEEKWADFRKLFDYMINEYSKVKYDGKKIDPYPDRVNKFYDNLPKELIDMWSKAYPNVDIKGECEKSRVWLLSNTNKAKKDFKNFTNRWLGKACQNGGSIPVVMEHKVEKRIQEHKRYVQQATENPATEEEKQEILSEILANLSKKKRISK